MSRITHDGLTAIQSARLSHELAKRVRIDGAVTTWGEYVATVSGAKKVTDDMASYNRRRFNSMGYREQSAYMARLEAKRVYCLLEPHPTFGEIMRPVPKVIYDAVLRDDDAGEAEALANWTDADSIALFGSV